MFPLRSKMKPFYLSPLLFSLNDVAFPKKIVKYQFFSSEKIFPLCHFKCALAQRRMQCFWIMWSNKVYSLNDRALNCICGWHHTLCSQFWVPESMQGFYGRISFLMCLEGLRLTGIQSWFLTLSLAHLRFSRFSDYFDHIMYCRWRDINAHYTEIPACLRCSFCERSCYWPFAS